MIAIDHFIFPSFLTSIVTAALAIFILLDGRWRRKTYLAFAFYSLSISLWAFTVIRFNSQFTDPHLFWGKLLHIGATGIPTFFISFIYCFLRDKHKRTLYTAYGIGALFVVLIIFSDTIVNGIINHPEYSAPRPGILYPFYFAFFAWSTFYGIIRLWLAYRKSEGLRRNQLKLLIASFVIGYTGGMKNFMLYLGWHPFPVYPYGTYAVLVLVVIVLYAILRYHLMDIEVIIKRTLVFASLFAFSYGAFALFALIGQQVFEKYISVNRWVSLLPPAVLIVLVLRPLENFLINTTDKYLFQRKVGYKELLRKFIDSIVSVPNLDEVINSTVTLLKDALHLKNFSIYLHNRVRDHYEIHSYIGLKVQDESVPTDAHIIKQLKLLKEPIIAAKERNRVIDLSDPIQKFMVSNNTEVCVPFLLGEELIGFLSLGQKLSDQDYTQDDLDILNDLGRTEAIAISNALLVAETAQNEKRAAIGTLAAGINHEICNPLNIMGTKLQAFLMASEAGLYREKSKEQMFDDIKGIMDTCLDQIARIADITKKLSSFAKPSREVKHQLISITEALDDTLSVIGHELELEKVKIEKMIEEGLPPILADRSQLQQIFFNIIRNGGQAIEGAGTVSVKAFRDGNEKVCVEISDTGSGIPEDKLTKIFDPFYTTKPPGKGTGLGLSIVRQLVARNRGEMFVASKIGSGTTFTLEFPEGKNGET